MATMVTVTLSVPEDAVGALYTYAATLMAPRDEGAAEVGGTRWGFGREAVKRAYLGGVSDYWRPFLQVLARQRDEWVAWHALCEEVGLTPSQASGMIGAAERRCKGRPPYEKCFEDGEYYFRMPASVAEVVDEVSGGKS